MDSPRERLIAARDRFTEINQAATGKIVEIERRLISDAIYVEFDVVDGHGNVIVRWCGGSTGGAWRFRTANDQPLLIATLDVRVRVAQRLSLDDCYTLAADAYDRLSKHAAKALLR